MKEYAPQAQILFDWFHIVKHLNEAVEEVRRSEMRRLSRKEKVAFKRSRWLLLKNPWNLSDDHLEKWMRSAMRSRLDPFKKFVRMLRGHLDGILAWTRHRISSGAVEGMNNKIKSISHRSFGFRTAEHFIAAIYRCCARLPRPVER